jgi:hypothetical protein
LFVELKERHGIRPTKTSISETGFDDNVDVLEQTPRATSAPEPDLVYELSPSVEFVPSTQVVKKSADEPALTPPPRAGQRGFGNPRSEQYGFSYGLRAGKGVYAPSSRIYATNPKHSVALEIVQFRRLVLPVLLRRTLANPERIPMPV